MITYCPRCGTPFPERLSGGVPQVALRCDDCALVLTEAPLMLAKANVEDEVEYDLGEWEVPERTAATTALTEVDIPYRWEEALVLVVPAVAETEVDQLLDELDEVEEAPAGAGTDGSVEVGEEDAEGDGGAEAQEAMGDLFVSADRLQHEPTDSRMIVEALVAEGVVAASLPPYGVERPVWRHIQALAAALAADLEETADEDTVAADARALREYLRDLV